MLLLLKYVVVYVDTFAVFADFTALPVSLRQCMPTVYNIADSIIVVDLTSFYYVIDYSDTAAKRCCYNFCYV